MNTITFDTQATVGAQSRFDAYRQRLQDEQQAHATRRDALAACLDTCRITAVEMSGFSHPGEHIWSASGLGGVLCQCQAGRGELEQIKSECLVTIQDLCELLPGPAATHFQHHSDEIQAILAAAFEGYLIIESILTPTNLSELIASPGIALGEFERLTMLLANAIVACGLFAEYLARLIVDEIEIVECLDLSLADVTTPVGAEALPPAGRAPSNVSPGPPAYPHAGSTAPTSTVEPAFMRPRMMARQGLTAGSGMTSGILPGTINVPNNQEGNWLGGLAVVVTGLVALGTTATIATQVAGSAKRARARAPGNDAQASAQDAEDGVTSGAASASAEDDLGNNIAGVNIGSDISFSAGIGVEIVADTAAKLPFLGTAGGTAV